MITGGLFDGCLIALLIYYAGSGKRKGARAVSKSPGKGFRFGLGVFGELIDIELWSLTGLVGYASLRIW